MKIKKTQRGFELIDFKDANGEECSLQKSSAAERDLIWLGVDEANPQIMASHAHKFGVETTETCGWVPYPVPEEVSLTTRMHLSQEQVKALLPHLIKFAETGEITID